MEYNISQKINKENGHSTFTVEGDKEFTSYIESLFKTFKDVLLMTPYAIGKRQSAEKHVSKEYVPTIRIDDEVAELISEHNTGILDRLIFIKDNQGKTIGLKIKI